MHFGRLHTDIRSTCRLEQTIRALLSDIFVHYVWRGIISITFIPAGKVND
jgi:hypothetical protein